MCAVSGTQRVKNHPGIYSYQLANGRKRYAAVASFQGAQKWTRGHLTIVAAEEAKALALSTLKRGDVPDVSPQMTLAEFLRDHWLKSVDVKPGSLRNYTVAVNNVIACIGDVRLTRINDAHLERFKVWMRDRGLSANTRSRTYGRLVQALRYARQRRFIAIDPSADIAAPPKGKYEPPPMGLHDVRRLLEAAYATPHGLMVYLPVVSGLRESELFGATWSWLDVSMGTLHVAGKGDKVRDIIIDPGTLALLQQHRLEQMRRFAELGAPPSKLIFTTVEGLQWTQSNFYASWNKIRIAAELPTLHFHDLRHLHSSLGSRAGVPIKVMQKRLGHADAKITLDIYTHAELEEQRPAAAAIAAVVRSAFDPGLSENLARES